MRKPFKCFGIAMRQGLLATAVCVPMMSGAMAADIPWKGETFERTSFDEDIRNVLRAVLKQNGLEVVFRPGVQGTVTSTFSQIPLQGAFNKLVEENGLQYEYSESTKTVTIGTQGKSASEFIPLKNLDEAMVRGVRDKFRLGAEIIYDDKTKTMMLKGDPDQVAKLKDLIAKLEASQAEIIKAHQEDESHTVKASLTDAEARMKAAEAQRLLDQNEAARSARLDIENISVEVIPLHYASVGPVRVKFQGEDVSIPGVINTLNTLLGVNDKATAAPPSNAAGLTGSPPATGQEVGMLTQAQGTGNAGAGEPMLSRVVVRNDPMAFRGTISEDTRTNSVIVRGTLREIDQVKKLIPKLDKPMEQVEIEAMIAQTSQGTLQQLGLRFGNDTMTANSRGGVIGGAFTTLGTSTAAAATGLASAPYVSALGGRGLAGMPSGTVAAVSPLSLLPTTSSGTVASFLYRGADFALTAQLNALQQDQKAHVLAAPRVVTLDNIAAKITSDGTTFVPTSAGVGSAGAFLQIPAGLTLKITPSVLRHEDVSEDNLIRLVIEAENTAVRTSAGGPSRSGQQIQTQVVIPDRSTFIMGGLTNDNRTENLDHVPLLSEIPILGELFKMRESDQSLSEVLFFITPRVVPRADLYAKDVAEKRYLQNQRAEIDRIGDDVRNRSTLLKLNTKTLEEDE